eukprot:2206957-Amphidinium_carterae.2
MEHLTTPPDHPSRLGTLAGVSFCVFRLVTVLHGMQLGPTVKSFSFFMCRAGMEKCTLTSMLTAFV